MESFQQNKRIKILQKIEEDEEEKKSESDKIIIKCGMFGFSTFLTCIIIFKVWQNQKKKFNLVFFQWKRHLTFDNLYKSTKIE